MPASPAADEEDASWLSWVTVCTIVKPTSLVKIHKGHSMTSRKDPAGTACGLEAWEKEATRHGFVTCLKGNGERLLHSDHALADLDGCTDTEHEIPTESCT